MYSSQTDLKSVSIARALSQMEGIFQNEEAHHTARLHYAIEKDSDLSVYAHFIQENSTILGQTMNFTCKQESAIKPLNINEVARKRFFSILRRAAKAHEGISRQERLFVQQFWSLWENVKS